MLTSNSFKMNTYKNRPQVFILIDLHKTLSPLESAFTKKGGGGVLLLTGRFSSLSRRNHLLV